MSGIAAVVSWDGSGIERSDVERMANVLKPYGPNRQTIVTRRNASFVFCRHDLTPEDRLETQPLILADRWVMLFDGRIDNRSELGAILGISTSELRVTPDSAIALRIFDRWGQRAFEQIVGVFAVIIMDLHDNRLLCARDHVGLRVLHYHRSAGRFAVATTPEALFALSWVPRILSKQDLADRIAGRWPNNYGETTYYQDIFRVRPGFVVQACGEKLSKRQFWGDPENIADVRFKNDDDYVEAFKSHLDEAVRASLRSIGAPCAMITGGLDSSSIAVVAADMLAASGNNRLNTFTAVPEAGFARKELPGRYFDETPYVNQIAAVNQNIVPHFTTQNRRSTPENIAQLIRMSKLTGGTLNSLWGVDVYAAAHAAGHNVMLCGGGGNVTMSYNGWELFSELLLTGHWLKLFSEIRSSGYRWRRHVRHMLIPVIPTQVFRKYKQWRRGQNPPWHNWSYIHPEFAARSEVVDRAARENEDFGNPPPRDTKLCRIRDLSVYCELGDWHAMVRANFHLDIRMPAFDRRLLEFCFGIPLDQYLRRGCDRWLIRRAMEGRLPPMVLQQKKFGAQAADWYPRLTRERHHIAEEVNRLAENPEVEAILDMQRLKKVLNSWPDHQPAEYTSEEAHLMAIPDALGEAYFIEHLMGINGSVLQSSNSSAKI